MAKMVRVNSRVSEDVNNWLDEESSRTGVAKSTLIYLALEQYINQKESMAAMRDLNTLVERLENLENKVEDEDE